MAAANWNAVKIEKNKVHSGRIFLFFALCDLKI